jgi:predicted transcriptional regulator
VNVSKDDYSHFTLRKVLDNYFDGSINKMVSFFSRKENLNLKDVEELLNLLKQKNEGYNG